MASIFVEATIVDIYVYHINRMPNGISRVFIDSFKSVVIVWYTYIETISPSTIPDYILIFHDRMGMGNILTI